MLTYMAGALAPAQQAMPCTQPTRMSDDTTDKIAEESREDDLSLPEPALPSEYITFTRKRGYYVPANQGKLEHSLLPAVGFLELANAGDFAANVWNTTPAPPFAVALMAVGGTIALLLSYFAFKDARLSWSNIIMLRRERHDLRRKRAGEGRDEKHLQELETRLNVNFRETGNELINRAGLDIFLGFGAVVVGIGTFMAIGGANHRVWYASNLLTGYVGNSVPAFYSLINGTWCLHMWIKAHQQHTVAAKALSSGVTVTKLKRRLRIVQTFATVNGVAGVVGAAGSLVTATMWWGYVILLPVIISSVTCNYIWRHKIGYERTLFAKAYGMSKDSLLKELEFVISIQQMLTGTPSVLFNRLVEDPHSISQVVQFITSNGLLEDFYSRLLLDMHLTAALTDDLDGDIRLDANSLLTVEERFIPGILQIAQTCVSERGPRRFKYRERYLLETLGYYLCVSGAGAPTKA